MLNGSTRIFHRSRNSLIIQILIFTYFHLRLFGLLPPVLSRRVGHQTVLLFLQGVKEEYSQARYGQYQDSSQGTEDHYRATLFHPLTYIPSCLFLDLICFSSFRSASLLSSLRFIEANRAPFDLRFFEETSPAIFARSLRNPIRFLFNVF